MMAHATRQQQPNHHQPSEGDGYGGGGGDSLFPSPLPLDGDFLHSPDDSVSEGQSARGRARGENTGKPIIKIVAHLIDLCLCTQGDQTKPYPLVFVTERLVLRVETNTGLCDQILSSLPVLL